MKLVTFSIYDEPADFAAPSGAVLLDADTGIPYPIPPGEFKDQHDATAFLQWAGDAINYAPVHARALARQWKEVRTHLPCPTCPDGHHGRAAPGAAQCAACLEETEHERASNHLREPGRNAVVPAGSRWT